MFQSAGDSGPFRRTFPEELEGLGLRGAVGRRHEETASVTIRLLLPHVSKP